MSNALIVGFLVLLALFVLRFLARRLRRSTVRSIRTMEEKPQRETKRKTVLVQTESELLAAITDVYFQRSDRHYIVRIDATKWNNEDVLNAAWLQAHPNRRIKIEQLTFPEKGS